MDNSFFNELCENDDFCIVTDFDRTLTKGYCGSLWKTIYSSSLLSDDFRKEYDTIHNNFKTNYSDNLINQKNYENRFQYYFRLFTKYNITKSIISESIKKTTITLRDGVKDFFKKMSEKDIPIIIISCSPSNIIFEFLKNNGISLGNIQIHSNYYDLDSSKRICNVTPFNKSDVILDEKIQNIFDHSKNIYLFGDMIDDTKMVDEKYLPKTTKIGFLNSNIEERLSEYLKHFDKVYTNVELFVG